MKFTLELNEEIMIEYAKFLGFEESDLMNLNENEDFLDRIAELLEEMCEYSMDK